MAHLELGIDAIDKVAKLLGISGEIRSITMRAAKDEAAVFTIERFAKEGEVEAAVELLKDGAVIREKGPQITTMTPSDVSELLWLPPNRVSKLAKAGKIPCVQLPGGELLFFRETIMAWLRQLPKPDWSNHGIHA